MTLIKIAACLWMAAAWGCAEYLIYETKRGIPHDDD